MDEERHIWLVWKDSSWVDVEIRLVVKDEEGFCSNIPTFLKLQEPDDTNGLRKQLLYCNSLLQRLMEVACFVDRKVVFDGTITHSVLKIDKVLQKEKNVAEFSVHGSNFVWYC